MTKNIELKGFTVIEFMMFLALVVVAVFIIWIATREPSQPIAERVNVECLDGFEYYTQSFRTYNGVGVVVAPKWDKDGKPRRCTVEFNNSGGPK
jgi:hypothetical protein